MTNKEYYEKNNISFSEALKDFSIGKYNCLEHWLYAEHELKFKVGDIVAGSGENKGIFFVNVILGIDNDRYITAYYNSNWVFGPEKCGFIRFEQEHLVEKIGVCTNKNILNHLTK